MAFDLPTDSHSNYANVYSSDFHVINSGALQGSELAPTLFLPYIYIYINDFHFTTFIKKYAD